MSEQTIMDLGMRAIWVIMKIAAPPLLAILVSGLIISIVQAATQINEQTLSFIPKILVMTAVLVITGPWIIQTLVEFTVDLFKGIPTFTQ
jgi:flagellar biosynthesis protein FliQ